MLRVRYSQEASNYFFDNGDLVFNLRVLIEALVFSNGLPETGDYTQLPSKMIVWEVMNHTVVYTIEGDRIMIWSVIPN